MSRESDLQQLVGQAVAAYRDGRPVFVARLKSSVWGPPGFGQVEHWEDCVAAVEAAGWRLDKWAVGADSAGSLSAIPLFRRGVPQDRR